MTHTYDTNDFTACKALYLFYLTNTREIAFQKFQECLIIPLIITLVLIPKKHCSKVPPLLQY